MINEDQERRDNGAVNRSTSEQHIFTMKKSVAIALSLMVGCHTN